MVHLYIHKTRPEYEDKQLYFDIAFYITLHTVTQAYLLLKLNATVQSIQSLKHKGLGLPVSFLIN